MTLKQLYIARLKYNSAVWTTLSEDIQKIPSDELRRERTITSSQKLLTGTIEDMIKHILIANIFIYKQLIKAKMIPAIDDEIKKHLDQDMTLRKGMSLQEVVLLTKISNEAIINDIEAFKFSNDFGNNELALDGSFGKRDGLSPMIWLEHFITHFLTHAAGLTEVLINLGLGRDSSMSRYYVFPS